MQIRYPGGLPVVASSAYLAPDLPGIWLAPNRDGEAMLDVGLAGVVPIAAAAKARSCIEVHDFDLYRPRGRRAERGNGDQGD